MGEARAIAVAVVLHAGSVLVGRRAADAAEAAGAAEFPGGKVEPGETTIAAACRECLEEAGIAVRPLDHAVTVAPAGRAAIATITFHWTVPLDPAATPRPPFRWMPVAELASLDFPPANAAVVASLLGGGLPPAAHGGS